MLKTATLRSRAHVPLLSLCRPSNAYISSRPARHTHAEAMVQPGSISGGRTTTVGGLAQQQQVKRPLATLTQPPALSTPEEVEELVPGSSIRILRTVAQCRAWTASHAQRPSLIPTMGALHDGHLTLIRAAATEALTPSNPETKADSLRPIVVSIYVNPAQFGIKEDLASYPKTWDEDLRILADLHQTLQAAHPNHALPMAIFAPTTAEMYPSGFPGQEPHSKGSFVTITPVGELLEGASRPTFFRGVATVCMKLFNIVQPDKAYFGQKDVQQTVVIRKMVRDLCMPIDVRIVGTVREESGLAMSSRNVYLGERRRDVAVVLSKALRAAAEVYGSGVVGRERILGAAHSVIDAILREQNALPPTKRALFEVDYISLADPDSMVEIGVVDTTKGGIVSGAIRMAPVETARDGEDLGYNGGPPVRLIDNTILEAKESQAN